MKLSCAALCIVMLSVAATANDEQSTQENTGMDLIKECAADSQGFKLGLCLGLIEGVSASGKYCIPRVTTVGQLKLVVQKYLTDNPDKLNSREVDLIDQAIRKAWPCRKGVTASGTLNR